ncbi:MAG: RelA/SpoT family protein [Thermodesulfobacteriota bacterium]
MVRLEDIIDKVAAYNPSADLELLKKAYVFSAVVHKGQTRRSGEPYLSHPLEVANLLADLKMDSQSVATGLLHDTVEDTRTTMEKIEEVFGPDIALLVDGLTKISRMTFEKTEDREAENFRKMILAMGKDIRVIMIKLADRMHNMRTLGALEQPKREKIALETLEIYAPLANRLGMGWIKAELEDLSFKYLEPDSYKWLEQRITRAEDVRHDYIGKVVDAIKTRLEEHGVDGAVSGRPKHIFSIHRKMTDQDLDLEDINDIFAFRIIVGSIRDCYAVLGVIHSTWKPVPGRFKDYIAIPKPNGYQSLHTTVIGPEGVRMEVQIRTEEMHRVAEVGIASHWKYKEGRPHDDTSVDKSFAWLRELLDLQKELKDSDEFMESLKVDLFPEEVFVFTPQGEVKEFPLGATPIDFAYAIHSDIGRMCVGAKINGKMVPLRTRLRNGDTVEILTNSSHHPSKDWLKYVATSRARNRIRQWIKTEERDRSIALGREICDREFAKYGVDFGKLRRSGELERIGREHFKIKDTESLMASVGYGKFSARQLLRKILPAEELEPRKRFSFLHVFDRFTGKEKAPSESAVVVQGEDDILVKFAGCCNPLPGDGIIGFVTHGQGVSVHAARCPNLLNTDKDRWIDVKWDLKTRATRPVKIEVICKNEKGVLAEVTGAINSADANIANADIKTIPEENRAVCAFEVEVEGITHLKSIIGALKKIKNVVKAERLRPHLAKVVGAEAAQATRIGHDGEN